MKPYYNRLRLIGDWCIYCGLFATTEDHFPPKSYCHNGLLLPACQECNKGLGNRFPKSLSDRMDLAKKSIETKHKKYLNHIEWSEEELNSMSLKFRKEFAAWKNLKHETINRLAWNARVYLSLIVKRSDFARLGASLGFSQESEPVWLMLLKTEFQIELSED